MTSHATVGRTDSFTNSEVSEVLHEYRKFRIRRKKKTGLCFYSKTIIMKYNTNNFLFLFLPHEDKGRFKFHLFSRSGC